jgi:hypothetical protein
MWKNIDLFRFKALVYELCIIATIFLKINSKYKALRCPSERFELFSKPILRLSLLKKV